MNSTTTARAVSTFGNPYLPMIMHIADIVSETGDGSLKTFDLAFEQPGDRDQFFSQFRPGQFCQLSIFGKGEAPFGVAGVDKSNGTVKFTINKMALFTSAVHAKHPGDGIGLRGPLGNWYPLEKWPDADILIIGGGYAFTTLYALIDHIMDARRRHRHGKLTVLYGARDPDLFLYKRSTATWHGHEDIEFHQTVDQGQPGWRHHVGLVPKVLKQIGPSAENAVAFICGPPVMIRFTLPVLEELGFGPERIYTSMEKRMKCGIGKCGRCNIGPDYICVDGPVFSLKQLQQLPGDF